MFGKEIYCGTEFIEEDRDTFIIYKSFITINTCSVIGNYNIRIQKFYDLKLIDEETYNKWYNKNL
jgi:hypothetical protein